MERWCLKQRKIYLEYDYCVYWNFDNYNYEHDGSTKGFSALKEISIKNKKIISVYSGNKTINLSSKRRGRLKVVGNKIFTLASDQKKFL